MGSPSRSSSSPETQNTIVLRNCQSIPDSNALHKHNIYCANVMLQCGCDSNRIGMDRNLPYFKRNQQIYGSDK